MVQMLKELIERRSSKKQNVIAHREGDALIINCLECGFTPEPATKECLRCMVNNMSELGSADKIILRTGMDMEISGLSSNIIRDISSLKKWSIPEEKGGHRCRNCGCSRSSIMTSLWDTFPEMGFPEAYYRLDMEGRQGGCYDCVKRSIRAVEQLESDLDDIISKISR